VPPARRSRRRAARSFGRADAPKLNSWINQQERSLSKVSVSIEAEIGHGRPHPKGEMPYHAFPAPDGTRRSREDTKEAAFEIRRAIAEPAGHARTCNQDGSGP